MEKATRTSSPVYALFPTEVEGFDSLAELALDMHWYWNQECEEAKHVFDVNVLTMGFARRFATYKRPNLLLHDPERLLRILTDPQRPMQLVIAGKAHPADYPGQAMIREDGTDYNLSWNCGWEGDLDVPPDVVSLRKQQIKNLCCMLLLANGTPMFRAGDEFMNTQGGNNNPYNQDNETSWLNWDLLEKNRDVFLFFKKMIAFRKAHPSLGRSRFWREDVRWYGVGNEVDYGEDSHSIAFCLHGASQNDADLYVMINAYATDLLFAIQEGGLGEWQRVVDTSLPSPMDFPEADREPVLRSLTYVVKARSVVVLIRKI